MPETPEPEAESSTSPQQGPASVTGKILPSATPGGTQATVAPPVGPPVWTVGTPGQPIPGIPGQRVAGPIWPGSPLPQTPRTPTLIEITWPGAKGGAPRATLSAIIVAAVVGAVSLVLNRPGFGWLLTGLVVAAAVMVTGRTVRQADPWTWRNVGERVFWAVMALALLAMGTFRDSGWLFFLCVVTSLGCGSIALAGGRTVKGLALALITWTGAIFRAPAWAARGVKAARTDRGGPRVVLAVVMSIGLVLVFGGLFAAADAQFAHVLGSIMPKWTRADVARAIVCFVLLLLLTGGATYLAAARPTYSTIASATRASLRRVEWALPVAVLNVLFAVFVYIQLTVFFGDGANTLATKSHAYMRGYAHSGFYQLLAVSLLTLTVIGVVSRFASRESRTDRMSLRVLLGLLSIFSIVIVTSAIKRLTTYEHLFGYTRLRVVVGGFEMWLGLVFVLVLLAGIKVKASWLPQVIAGSFVVALLAGAIANPDLYVANHNVNRYEQTGKLSIEYMRTLSADAVPAIERLPQPLRACSLEDIVVRLADRPDYWRTWNFSRVDARNTIDVSEIDAAARCPALVSRGR